MTLIDDKSIDFIITSPPYWNLKDYGHAEQIGAEDYETYLKRLRTVFDECFRVAKPNAVLALNIGNRRHKKQFYPIGIDICSSIEGWKLWDIVQWYIPNALPQPNHYMERLLDNKYESIYVFTKNGTTDYKFHKPRVPQKYITADPRAYKKNPKGRCIGNVVRIPAYKPPNVKSLGYHVAAFPEELVAFFLACYTDEGDTVLDPFVGSGTTLKVARGMGRAGFGIELNEEFVPLIRQRVDEPFELPDWRNLDILHSATMTTGMAAPRKIHLLRSKPGGPPANSDRLELGDF